MILHRGIIEGFSGSWGSGLGYLIVSGRAIPVDNGATVRALDAAFGNVIAEGHTVDQSAFVGQDIVYAMDEFGLVMAGFVPVDEYHGDLPEIGGSLCIGESVEEDDVIAA